MPIPSSEQREWADTLTERILGECYRAFDGLCSSFSPSRCADIILEALADREAAHSKSEKAMRALESLTVGGSEFVGDVERCMQNIRDRREGVDKLHLVKLRKMSESLDAERKLREAAEKVLAAADLVHYTGPTFGGALHELRRALSDQPHDAGARERMLIEFKAGKFVVDGKKTSLWIVGGTGDLLKEGNAVVISGEALKQLVQIWVRAAGEHTILYAPIQ